jgi:hypothetical protein
MILKLDETSVHRLSASMEINPDCICLGTCCCGKHLWTEHSYVKSIPSILVVSIPGLIIGLTSNAG